MRSILVSALIGCAALAASASDSALTGNWNVHNSIAGNESDMACTITQKDTELTGTCKSDQSSGTIAGKADGNTITWTYKTEYNGGPLSMMYSGNLASTGKMNGTVKVQEYDVEGEFTATLSK